MPHLSRGRPLGLLGLFLAVTQATLPACSDGPKSSGTRAEPRPAPPTGGREPVLESRAEPVSGRRGLRRRGGDGVQVMGETFRKLKEAAKALTPALNDFSLALAKALPPDPQGNTIVSPWAVSTALHMVLLGARGETEQEMRKALRVPLPGPTQHTGLSLLNLRVRRSGGSPTAPLHAAFRAWRPEARPVRPEFAKRLRELYGEELAPLGPTGKRDQATDRIGGWLSTQTRGVLPKLTSPLGPDARLVVVSAATFRGRFATPFQAAPSRVAPFHGATGEAKVPFLGGTGPFPFVEAEGVKVIALPYRGNQISLLVLLPVAPGGDALAAVEKRLDEAQLARLRASLQPSVLAVRLPRFRLSGAPALRPALETLGMRRAFTPQADFSGMADGPEPLFVSELRHQALVTVEPEAGPAPASASGPPPAAAPIPTSPAPSPELRLDRPFLFVILHEKTGTILFVGRVGTPLG